MPARAPAHPGTLMALGEWSPPGGPPRPVRAWIPGRELPDRPALVLLDGQNVLGDHGSYAGGWHAHDAVDRLGLRTVSPPLVIAVGNGGTHRITELGRDLERFLTALAHELLPALRARLWFPPRVTLGGASLGGLAALCGVIRHPEVFGAALAMSPSLWFGHRALLHQIERGDALIPADTRIYLDAGKRERGQMFADAAHLAAVLGRLGLGPDRLLWRPDRQGTHHERHWRRRLPKALRFLFRRR